MNELWIMRRLACRDTGPCFLETISPVGPVQDQIVRGTVEGTQMGTLFQPEESCQGRTFWGGRLKNSHLGLLVRPAQAPAQALKGRGDEEARVTVTWIHGWCRLSF